MRVLVPYDSRDPNTRLSSVLDARERRELATVMRDDVLKVIEDAGHSPVVLATEPVDLSYPARVDDRPLSLAVNEALSEFSLPVAIVMADLALATPAAIQRLFGKMTDVVLAPGLGGGTNAILVRDPDFRVDYHGGSYRKHREEARNCDASVGVVDSFRLAVDVDEPGDLAEVLLHGRGNTPTWLREAGFERDTSGGRTAIRRRDQRE